jgi:oleate hydratase
MKSDIYCWRTRSSGAQMAVYQFLEITRLIPPILHHDESVKVRLNAFKKAF